MLGAIELEIHSGDGRVLKLDPNNFVISAFKNSFDLGPPAGKSFLSQEDAWLYREDDFGVLLSLEELRRLAARELMPDQYLRLRETFGLFHSIHDDFYDESGIALQPKGLFEDPYVDVDDDAGEEANRRGYRKLADRMVEFHGGDGGVLLLTVEEFASAVFKESFDFDQLENSSFGESFLSGEPGWLFREDDLGVVLTMNEIRRLGGHELTPEQYFKLREHFGQFRLIGPEFYDEKTGKALQPKGAVRDEGGPAPRLH